MNLAPRPPSLICLDERTAQHEEERLEAAGWRIVRGFEPSAAGSVNGRARICRVGPVDDLAQAGAAVSAVVRGEVVICIVHADQAVADALFEDLRHLGAVEIPAGNRLESQTPVVDEQSLRLLRSLATGKTLGVAAAESHISRRTADRRLASVRRTFGAATTAQALVIARRIGLLPGARESASRTTID